METTPVEPDADPRFVGLEVTTTSADTLRASIKVVGALLPDTTPLLTSVLRTHVTAGRRYLRVDLKRAEVTENPVLTALVEAHRAVEGLGGMLVFENAGPRLLEAIRDAALFASPSD